jgi:DNA-directed RNA polymerase subunit beta'
MSYKIAYNTHQSLLTNLSEKLQELLNAKTARRELRIVKVEMPEAKYSDDMDAQKNAKIQGISYVSPVKGHFELLEDGKVVDRKVVKLFDLPNITRRGTYIVGGNEYHFPLQKRLIPGVYTTEKNDGTISAWLNSSKGRNMEIVLREKGDFIISVEKASTINLLAFLLGMGMDASEIRRAWGEEVYNTNAMATGGANPLMALEKFYEKTHYVSDPEPAKKDIPGLRAWITEYFNNKSEFDGPNVKITLGTDHTKTSPRLMLDASIRILDVSRGNKPEDNKESLIHNSIHDLSDFMVERVGLREYASKVKRTLERNLQDPKKDSISKIYQPDLIQKPVDSTFTQISISKMPKQNNPMDTMASFSEITVMGEGGISDLHQVTRDVRALDPTHFAFIDPAHTPEGENIGTTLHLASTTKKVGKDLYQSFVDVKGGGKGVELNPRQVYTSYVTFPEYWDFKKKKIVPDAADGLVRAMHFGELKRVKPQEVQYSLIDSTQLLGVNTMAVPFVSHNNGTRIMTAAKMQSQAKPLKYREAPLIQSLTHEGATTSVEQIMAQNILAKSPADGVVKSVKGGEIVIKGDDGKDYPMSISNKFWMNENNYEHEESLVKVGDKVKKGQLLTESNYTKDGTLALGTNLNTAYVSYRGLNHEDGVVISETGAKKLTSLHAYQHPVSFTDQDVIDKKKFTSHFPATFTQTQVANIGDDGIIKVNSVIVKGDPLVLKMRKVEEDTISRKLANVSRLLVQDFKDTSDIWEKAVSGKVVEVHPRKKDVLIVIETEEPAKIGDKLVGRFGNKGTITTIIADDEMPKDQKGQVMDILFDPTGVPGRMNLGQILETTASKIADKTGQPYMAKPFGGDHTNKIGDELDKHKLKDHDTLTDGDQKIEGVLAGKQYFLKLEHQVDKKLSARGAGVGYSYTMDGQPSKGSGTTGQAIGLGEMYALLAHGAQANLAEMYTFKSDKQLEAWRAIENGTFMPPPEMPASSERFVNMLRGMGVDLIEDDKNVVRMTPFLDRDVRKISNGKIEDATVLRAKDLKEEKGGLYDFKTTGGLQGDKWSHIELAEPVPHPTFEFAILAVTKLKKQEFEDVMAGKLGVKSGKIVSADEPGAVTAGEGIKALLGSIDPESRLKEILEEAKKAKGSDLNKLHREARVLKNFKDNKIDLKEMIVNTIPVLPPKFRPIVEMSNGDINVADVNEHYRAAILMNNHLKEYKGRPGLRDEANKVRRDLFEGMRGVMGMSTGLVTKPDVKGIAEQIAGSSPKYGYFHSKLLKRRQDTSGRGVVGPGPELDMDTLGIPENMAWNMFEPYVIKDLKAQGLTSMRARSEINDRTPFARDALLRTMDSRPVIMNRAPTLHKFSIMAFKPKLVPGSAIKVPIEVLGGLNMDFDGDQAGVHVPATPEAVKEAWGMVASKNLYQSGTGREKLSPSLGREYMLGVFKLTRDGKTTGKMYDNAETALRDAQSRKIGWTDIISVKNLSGGNPERTTAGKILINQTLPSSLRNYQATYTESYQKQILTEVGKLGGETFKKIIGEWKDAGRTHVYESGTSFLLSDLKALTKERKAFYAAADIEAQKVRTNTKLSKEERDKKLIEIYGKVDREIKAMSMSLPDNKSGKSNNIADMVASGMSKPGPDQLKQLVGTVGLMMDHRQQVIPEPVRGNYAEGLDTAEFFQHMYSQRKGMIDKSRSVSGPGMLSKELTNSGTQQKITMIDCGTLNGRDLVPDKNILDRMLATPAAGIARNTAIDSQLLGKIQSQKIPMVKVRSVLTCEAANGVCAMCFGIDDNGNLPKIGANVGVSEIQAVTERSVQLPMKAFHSGGVASADKGQTSAFDRALTVFRIPENVPNKATLAELDGKVDSIRPSGYGGFFVTIAGKDHKIAKGLEVLVKVGDSIEKGQKLSSGMVKAQEMLKLKGLQATQGQIAQDLDDAFRSGGIKFNRRTYEVASRMLTEQVRITDPGDNQDFVPGDFTTIQKVDAWNRENPAKKKIQYNTILPGTQMSPMMTDDWARRMSLSRIKGTIEEGAAMGFKSDRKQTVQADLVLGPNTRIKLPGEKRIKL